KLSSHPRLTAWLATDGLIRNFTVVVSNVAGGQKFANLLRRLQPAKPFVVVARGDPNNEAYVDARSYTGCDGLAEGVAALDRPGPARLYATLKPRIEEAYRELGEPEASFDRTLERAIVSLLETPVKDGPVKLKPHGGTAYSYVDER